jgi:SRSO17 transposase
MGGRFSDYLLDYEDIFRSQTKNAFDKAEVYCQGLFMSELSNIERISEEMSINYHQMQHFISESVWDSRVLIDRVSSSVSRTLPTRKLTGLLIDESGWEKKGVKSVGVSRQYCGNVGKVSNSQVAVFGSLSNGDFASMVDARLYLPKDWCDSSLRCEKAGIPESERNFKTKSEIALEMVRHQAKLGASFNFVGADGFYGHDIKFAEGVEALGYVYMVDIHSDQTIFTERPELCVPQKKSKRGRTPTLIKPSIAGMSVKAYQETVPENEWNHLTVRNTAKGRLKGDYHFRRVFIWNQDENRILPRLLVIRKTRTQNDEWEVKYSFTNANLEQYTQEGIAYMQAQRFFVEHSIKESKQILGMDQFQTRKWLAWHHQIALNLLVSSFILKEKISSFDQVPLLSARDIKDLVVFKLYKQMTEEQLHEKLFLRHLRRQKDINRAYDKQNREILIC